MTTCQRCGAQSDAAARFCSACGAQLHDQHAKGLEARKTVTILFCDTVGSTALGEATDPETTRRVMSRYAETMIEIVRVHGGTVERFRGDEVMAVFGVPIVHEDDALRAVRAGTEMQRALGRLNEELRSRFEIELACRIGINTGEVVAGDPSTGETFVTGDAVNLAKRLEQVAEPGRIMIGTATHALVKDAVRVGPRERFTAKGKSEDVGKLQLEDVDASAAGYARRLDAPLVGRLAERTVLCDEIDRLFAEGRCGVLTLVGPAGVGKSRLAHEVVSHFAGRARVATGRCLAYGVGITYWPLVELVQDLGGLEAVAEAVRGAEDESVALERLRSAIGEAELVAPSDEIFWGIRRVLEALAQRRPLLVCLEDIHWAEPTMLDLVEYVAAFGVGPVVVLCNARPELLESRPTWARHMLVELTQLTDAETEALIASLGIEDARARRTIAATAEGNPLFAEQLAAMVLESGDERVEHLAMPASIQALLAARLDSLEPGERRALERASVVGKEFWQRAVADLSPAADRPQVTTWLLSLSRKGLVVPVREDGTKADRFRFHHALIRDVAYGGIPKGVRADLHEGFAAWLRSQPEGFGEHDEIVGYHAEQAYRYLSALVPPDERTRALSAQAARSLAAAGRRAYARDDMRATSSLLGRAVELMGPDDPSRGELQFQLSGAAWSIGDRRRGDDALEAVLAAAERAGDTRLAWHALLERAARRGYEHGADADELLAVAEEARSVFAEANDSLGLARTWRRIANAQRLAGQFERAVEAGEEAFKHAADAVDGREQGRIVDGLCTALLYGPTYAPEAIARCEELITEARSTPSFEAAVLSSLAGLVAMRGDFARARRVYLRAKRLWEELGLRYAVAGLTQVGGELELMAENPTGAERELRAGAEMLETVGGNALQSALLAKALAAQGGDVEAEALAVAAERAAGGHEIQAEVIAGVTRAVVCARRGEHDVALELAVAAASRTEQSDALNLRADALVVLTRCLENLGRTAEAAARHAEARSLYVAKGNAAALARLSEREPAGLPSAPRRE